MAGYVKVFKQIFDGSLYGKFEPTVTFLALLVLAEKGGIVDMTPEAIAARSGFPLAIIRKGIADLEDADPRSRTETDEGRRITRLEDHRDWGWRIVNYEKYDRIRSAEERREYLRQKQAEHRAKKKGATVNTVNTVNTPSTVSTSSSSSSSSSLIPQPQEEDLDTSAGQASGNLFPGIRKADTYSPEFQSFVALYPKRAGSNPKRDAFRAWNARLQDGSSMAEIMAGTARYSAFCRATGKVGTEYVQRAATFLGPSKGFLESWDLPTSKAEIRQDKNADAVADWLATPTEGGLMP